MTSPSQKSTKERISKVHNVPGDEEQNAPSESPPPPHCTSPTANRKGVCISGNCKSNGDELRDGIVGNKETEVTSKRKVLLPDIDEENVAAVTIGGQTSEESIVAIQQQSQPPTRKNSHGRSTCSETSTSATPVTMRSRKISPGVSSNSSDHCLKVDIVEMEARENPKWDSTTTSTITGVELDSEKINIKEELDSEKLKKEEEEQQKKLIVNKAESQGDNNTAIDEIIVKNVNAGEYEEMTVLTVPKKEKISGTKSEKMVVDSTEPAANGKDNSSTTGKTSESFSSRNRQLESSINNKNNNNKEGNIGEVGHLNQQGTSFSGSGDSTSVSVDKDGESFTIHNTVDVTNTPKQHEEVTTRKRYRSESEMPPTAQTTAERSNSNMGYDALKNVIPILNTDTHTSDVSPPIKKLRKTHYPPAQESGDISSNNLHLRKAATSELEKTTGKGTNVLPAAQKPTTASKTESAGNYSTKLKKYLMIQWFQEEAVVWQIPQMPNNLLLHPLIRNTRQ